MNNNQAPITVILQQLEQAVAYYSFLPESVADVKIEERYGYDRGLIRDVRNYLDELSDPENVNTDRSITDFRKSAFNTVRRHKRRHTEQASAQTELESVNA